MTGFSYALTEHRCELLGRTVLLPVTIERFGARLEAHSRCEVCGGLEFEKTVEKAVRPAKGYYATV